MKIAFGILFLVAIVTTTICATAAINNAAVDRWLGKAQAAGNPAQTAEFLGYYKDGLMEKYSPNQYYDVFRYPSTQFKVYYRVIDGLIARANDLSSMKSTDTAFQMGLLNIEKDINDIGQHSFDGWIAAGGFINNVLMIAAWLCLIILGMGILSQEM
jgi:hypothetical protein